VIHRELRLPDVDPAISQARAVAVAQPTGALKNAAFSIGAIAFLVVISMGWSELSKLQRGAKVELSASASSNSSIP